jgi:hypothetical protein
MEEAKTTVRAWIVIKEVTEKKQRCFGLLKSEGDGKYEFLLLNLGKS